MICVYSVFYQSFTVFRIGLFPDPGACPDTRRPLFYPSFYDTARHGGDF